METSNYTQSKLDSFINNPKKALWKMTAPFFLGLSVQSIYMLMDTMFVGKFLVRDGASECLTQSLSQSALDAMGAVFPLMFIIMGLTFGLGSGVTTLIAQYIGKKDKKSADSVASHTVIIGLILPIIITGIVLILGDSIMDLELRDASNTTKEYAKQYFEIMAFGSVFMILAIFFRSVLSGEGETVLPMKVLGFGTILNIILDPIFIIIFKLEVAGAAYATVISNGVVALSFMYLLIVKKKSYATISFKKDIFKFDYKIVKSLFKLGMPASLSFAIMSFGMFAQNSILSYSDQNPNSSNNSIFRYEAEDIYTNPNSIVNNQTENECDQEDGAKAKWYMGEESSGGVIGGYQTAARVENLFMNLVIALSSSIVTLVGMFYGAKRIDLIRYVINYALKWSIILSVIATAVFFFLSDIILQWFTNDSKTIVEGVNFFNICAFSLPFVAIGMLTCRAMQGMDKPTPFLFITVLRVILIALPMAWIGVRYFNYGVNWVWWSVLASSIITTVFSLMWMYKVIREYEQAETS